MNEDMGAPSDGLEIRAERAAGNIPGAPLRDGLVSAEAPEPCGLGPAGDIPSAEEWQCGVCESSYAEAVTAVQCCAKAKAAYRKALYAALPSQRAPVQGYMCLTDWEDELGHASDGNKVYPSIEALKRHSPCWQECGIMEVRVSPVTLIEPSNFPAQGIEAQRAETGTGSVHESPVLEEDAPAPKLTPTNQQEDI